MKSYQAARSLYSFVSGCAQLVIGVGGVIALLGAYYGQQNPIGFIGIGAGFVVALFGFGLLVFAQTGRTGVDSAEYAQQNLAVSREQLAISKELLTMAKQPQGGATYQAEAEDGTLQNVSYDTAVTAPETEPKPEPVLAETDSSLDHLIEYKDGKFLVEGKRFWSRLEAETHARTLLPVSGQ